MRRVECVLLCQDVEKTKVKSQERHHDERVLDRSNVFIMMMPGEVWCHATQGVGAPCHARDT